MPDESPLIVAIDRAIVLVRRARQAALVRHDGQPADVELESLASDLARARGDASATGRVDPAWMRDTIRGAASWLPESDITLLASLGAIARANRPTSPSTSER